MTEETTGSIDTSIIAIEEYIVRNQRAAKQVMMYLFVFSSVVMMAAIFPYLSVTDQPPSFLYALVGVFVVVFGVLMAVYRFHLNEIAKAEHNKIGFMRIRVAANNYDADGFQSEVRQSLTTGAFDYAAPSILGGSKGKNVESPLPGHPTSDVSAFALNKLLEGLEVRRKQ
ncbi:hypothetical protein [Halospina sp. K52047b]|uniref:hypothetical protein n=1 Tax=Halospina sp. K52047b TaxID=2614160 RepID=UPI00124A0F86|nr:hypothetical protein [Halospina sp. K52047b]KAA8981343.1 hypothetical protein F3089_10605 [Halospina sp. K52047b]